MIKKIISNQLKIQIAGINILLEGNLEFGLSERCEKFITDFSIYDVIFHLSEEEFKFLDNYELVYESDDFNIFHNNENIVKVKYSNPRKQEVYWYLTYNNRDNLYQVQVTEKWKHNLDSLNPLFFFELSEFLIRYNAMILHSSVIDFRGQGIVFTAPSGTGKSTQADLWKKYKDAEVLNGDRTIIRKIGTYKAYGSPYAGSSGIIKNKSVPLKAIIVLRQSKTNRICEMRTKEAYLALLSELSISRWNKKILDDQCNWILELIKQVPIYKLECTPDKDAVDILYNELKLGE